MLNLLQTNQTKSACFFLGCLFAYVCSPCTIPAARCTVPTTAGQLGKMALVHLGEPWVLQFVLAVYININFNCFRLSTLPAGMVKRAARCRSQATAALRASPAAVLQRASPVNPWIREGHPGMFRLIGRWGLMQACI